MAAAVATPATTGPGQAEPTDPGLAQCGFARLMGKDIDYIVQKYAVLLGRRSKASNVDVVLGDFMSVSRQHARILYNFDAGGELCPACPWPLHRDLECMGQGQRPSGSSCHRSEPRSGVPRPAAGQSLRGGGERTPEHEPRRPWLGNLIANTPPLVPGRWEVEVLGKNGVAVDGATFLPGDANIPLHSKALLQIGQDVSFHFLLPKTSVLKAWCVAALPGSLSRSPGRGGERGS